MSSKQSEENNTTVLQANDQWRVPAQQVFYGKKTYDVPIDAWEWGGLVAFKNQNLATVRYSMVCAHLCCYLSYMFLLVLTLFGFVAWSSYAYNQSGSAPSWLALVFSSTNIMVLITLYACLFWYQRKKVLERLQDTTDRELADNFKRAGWRIEFDPNSEPFVRYLSSANGAGSFVFSRTLEDPNTKEPAPFEDVQSPTEVPFIIQVNGVGMHLVFPEIPNPKQLLWPLGGINEKLVREHGQSQLTQPANLTLMCLSLFPFAFLLMPFYENSGLWLCLLFVVGYLLFQLVHLYARKVVENTGALEQAFAEILPMVHGRTGLAVEHTSDSHWIPGFPRRNHRLIFTPSSMNTNSALV